MSDDQKRSEKNYMTPAGFEKLKAEYGHLLNEERPKVVATVAWAASNGDRSENADYIYGKRRLREIDSRLRFLLGRLDKAFVVDPTTLAGSTVVFGATIKLEDEDGQAHVYQIVGEDEFDINLGKISWKSPVAKSVLGKKVGDEVTVRKPAGEQVFTIVELKFI